MNGRRCFGALVVGVPGEDVSQRVGVDAVETKPGDQQPVEAGVAVVVMMALRETPAAASSEAPELIAAAIEALT